MPWFWNLIDFHPSILITAGLIGLRQICKLSLFFTGNVGERLDGIKAIWLFSMTDVLERSSRTLKHDLLQTNGTPPC